MKTRRQQALELAPEVDVAQGQQGPIDKPDAVSESVSVQAPAHKRAPGRQPGAQGHGRTQHIEPTQHMAHHPACCASCGEGWKIQAPAKAYTAYDEIDLAQRESGELGVRLSCTRHALYDMTCDCGHQTRAQLYRANEEVLWDSVELGQWRLVGPRLAALMVYFGLRMRLSHERIKELLWELFGLALSKGTIGKTIREAGRAAAPLLDEIAAEIEAAELVHADETSWPEAGKLVRIHGGPATRSEPQGQCCLLLTRGELVPRPSEFEGFRFFKFDTYAT